MKTLKYLRLFKNSICYLILVLFLPFYCNAQTIIRGSVVDVNNEPVEFANVYVKNKPFGTTTDRQGEFYLELSDDQLILVEDSIIISHIGYTNVIKSLTTLVSEEKFILFAAEAYELEAVSIPGATMKESGFLGTPQKKTDQFFRNNIYESYQIATLIENEEERQGYIEELYIYIGRLGSREHPFRIKLFEVDTACNCPGNILLPRDILVRKIKSKWNKIDVSNYYVDIPLNGFFIGYEWLYVDTGKKGKTIFQSSHSIGLELNKASSVTYEKIGDTGWKELTFLNARNYKPMFKAKVTFYIVD